MKSCVWHEVLLRQMQHRLLPLPGHGGGGFAGEVQSAGSSKVDEEGAIRSVLFVHDEDVVELDVPVRQAEFVEMGGYLEHGPGELEPAVGVEARQAEDVAGVCGDAARVGQPHCAHPESVVDGGAAAGRAAGVAQTHQHAESTLTQSTAGSARVKRGNNALDCAKSVRNDGLTHDGQRRYSEAVRSDRLLPLEQTVACCFEAHGGLGISVSGGAGLGGNEAASEDGVGGTLSTANKVADADPVQGWLKRGLAFDGGVCARTTRGYIQGQFPGFKFWKQSSFCAVSKIFPSVSASSPFKVSFQDFNCGN